MEHDTDRIIADYEAALAAAAARRNVPARSAAGLIAWLFEEPELQAAPDEDEWTQAVIDRLDNISHHVQAMTARLTPTEADLRTIDPTVTRLVTLAEAEGRIR